MLYLLDLCRRSAIIFWPKINLQIVPHSGIFRGCAILFNYFISLYLLNNHSTLLLTFLRKNFVLPRQLQFKHAIPKWYIINLLNNIWNFDGLLAVQVYQDHFLLRYEYFVYENTMMSG